MHLFLSPHADDAPLSCGVTLHQLIANGERCIVYTFCDGDAPNPPPDTPIVNHLHAEWEAGAEPMRLRRIEDEDALRVLGVTEIYHGLLLDCIYRTDSEGTPLYTAVDSFKGTVHPRDRELQLERLDALPLPFGDEITHLHAPAAVGMHVDHQIVRDWALRLKARYPSVVLSFYEDYPYAERAEAIDAALDILNQQVSALTLNAYPASGADLSAKLMSLREYVSQIGMFWDSTDEMDTAITRFMTLSGQRAGLEGPAEREWIATV